ncbi:hypothetical protein AZ22_0776 [Bordetella bronchiseptica 980-2]|nr:hypothetical protein AZ22_0776 [Bordetella bronchiseptica 980-2]
MRGGQGPPGCRVLPESQLPRLPALADRQAPACSFLCPMVFHAPCSVKSKKTQPP